MQVVVIDFPISIKPTLSDRNTVFGSLFQIYTDVQRNLLDQNSYGNLGAGTRLLQ